MINKREEYCRENTHLEIKDSIQAVLYVFLLK
jgi:hypothetical protein